MKKRYIVSDTNIFIDLIEINLLDELFKLPWEIHTTDFVLGELKDVEQRKEIDTYVNKEMLKVKRYKDDEVMRLGIFKLELPRESNLSITDCSVLQLAQKLRCPLLTGDGKLRKMVESTIEVHGVLYVLEQYVELGLIDRTTAIERLKKLLSINPRLPMKETESIIKKWSGDGGF